MKTSVCRAAAAVALSSLLLQSGRTAWAQGNGPYCWSYDSFFPTPLPPGVVVQPGAELDKTWSLENCGSADWPGVRAVRTDGNLGPESFAIPDLASNKNAKVSITVQAPTAEGCYFATYKLAGTPEPFGSQYASITLEFFVPGPDGASPEQSLDLKGIAPALLSASDLGKDWTGGGSGSLVPFDRTGCVVGPGFLVEYSNEPASEGVSMYVRLLDTRDAALADAARVVQIAGGDPNPRLAWGTGTDSERSPSLPTFGTSDR